MTEIAFIALIYLIQNPDEYHAKKVRVIGPASIAFEHKAMYVTPDDFKNANTKNAIWLEVKIDDKTELLNNKYILVEGIFDKSDLGHLKLFSGTLKHISRIEPWKSD